MRGFLRYCAAALGCVLLTALPAAAQFDRGQISGTVKDAQGGVVPGVTVTRHQSRYPAGPHDRDGLHGLLHGPESARRQVRRLGRASGIQEGAPPERDTRRGELADAQLRRSRPARLPKP